MPGSNQLTYVNILLFFLFNFTYHSQVFSQGSTSLNDRKNYIQLSGTIIDPESDLPVAYVSIGILNKPIGTISDSTGRYNLTIGNNHLTDTLHISLIGYATRKIIVNELILSKDTNIRLSRNLTILDEVIVSGKKGIAKILGRQESSKFIQASVHQRKTSDESISPEIGMKIKNKRIGGLLKDFNWFVSGNNFKSIKFRVNIYSIKNDLPDSLLCHKQIFVTMENLKTGWNKIDLETFNINIDGDFVITLQWIESEREQNENPMALIPAAISLSKNCYARLASQDKWKKIGINLSYFVTMLY